MILFAIVLAFALLSAPSEAGKAKKLKKLLGAIGIGSIVAKKPKFLPLPLPLPLPIPFYLEKSGPLLPLPTLSLPNKVLSIFPAHPEPVGEPLSIGKFPIHFAHGHAEPY